MAWGRLVPPAYRLETVSLAVWGIEEVGNERYLQEIDSIASMKGTSVAARTVLLVSAVFALGCQAAAEPAALDALVSTQRYGEALDGLKQSGRNAAEQLDWLRRHGEAGHVPLQYELSQRLYPPAFEESLKWYLNLSEVYHLTSVAHYPALAQLAGESQFPQDGEAGWLVSCNDLQCRPTANNDPAWRKAA